jgi:hypothetical protein
MYYAYRKNIQYVLENPLSSLVWRYRSLRETFQALGCCWMLLVFICRNLKMIVSVTAHIWLRNCCGSTMRNLWRYLWASLAHTRKSKWLICSRAIYIYICLFIFLCIYMHGCCCVCTCALDSFWVLYMPCLCRNFGALRWNLWVLPGGWRSWVHLWHRFESNSWSVSKVSWSYKLFESTHLLRVYGAVSGPHRCFQIDIHGTLWPCLSLLPNAGKYLTIIDYFELKTRMQLWCNTCRTFQPLLGFNMMINSGRR